jgi:hypothetical protein
MTQTQNQQQYYYLHGYISVAIFWEHHQIQAFRDFERGKLGLERTGLGPHALPQERSPFHGVCAVKTKYRTGIGPHLRMRKRQ